MFNNLAAEIKRIGITNKDFAEKVKINPVTFSRKLNGKVDFTLSEMKKIAEVFNLEFNSVDLINEIKDSFNTSTKITTKEVLERYCKSDFMFIDDIDKLNPTDYARELMYSIVNIRYEKELPIVISSNSSIETLDEKYFGEAVVSRLLEKSTYIQFDLEDMRF